MAERNVGSTSSDSDGEAQVGWVDSDELLRLLVDSVTDYAIFVLDAEGYIRSWNPGAQRIKGYQADEIIGRHFSVFYPDEDRRAGKPARELEIATRNGRVQDEGWRLRKDGSRFWASVVITALRQDGKLVGFAKVTRDLTARRTAEEQARRFAAEQAARETSEKSRRTLEELNEQLQQQAVELESQTEEAQTLTEELEQANTELEQAVDEAEQARATAEQAERKTRYLVTVGDILATSNSSDERLRALVHVVVPEIADWCALDVIDEQGNTRQVAVAHVDPAKVALARELGERFPTDPHATTGVPEVLRTGKPELHPEIGDDLLAGLAVNEEHLALLRKLGLRSAVIVPLIARGRTLGALTLVLAESDRRFRAEDVDFAMEIARRAAVAIDNAMLHEQTLNALAAAQEANHAKAQFLAVMSHELRTPLNAIGGYAELLRTGIRGPVSPEQAHDLDRIMYSERMLLSLINDILNYAKIEAGRVQITLARASVKELLETVESVIVPQLGAKEQVLTVSDPSPELTACTDSEKVRQILLNLLTNASKFSPRGARLSMSAHDAGSEVHITIEDNGPGIPQERLMMIFEPFVQLDRSLTSDQHGTGLGLSISRDLARAMKGDLVVDSALGKGSRFTLILPRN